ncbi:MAG: hypothetical protein EPN91_06575 [Salinibacterium sp.]|nr:MAG: hypothetical protein EPN91_06575 [Salinibacterium sp.]
MTEKDAIPEPVVDANDSAIPVAVPTGTSGGVSSRPRRVTPDPNRPKLPAEFEEKLAPLDEASAQTYDGMEDAAERFRRYAEEDTGGVVQGPFVFTESLVFDIKGRPPEGGAPKKEE